MINKVVISVLVLAVGILSFQLMNSPNGSRPAQASNRVATPPASAGSATPTTSENRPQRSAQDATGNPNGSTGGREPGQRPEGSANPRTDSSARPNGNTNPPTEVASADQTATSQPSPAQPSTQQPQRRGIGLNGGALARQGTTAVEVMRVEPALHRASLSVFGVIEAQTSVTLSATSAATVTSILRQEGDSVAAGDVLVALNSATTLEQLNQRKASLAELDARIRNENRKHDNDQAALVIEHELLRIAKNAVDRFTSLNAQQLGSNNDYETALRSYQSQLLSVQNRELTLAQYPDTAAQLQAQRAQLESQIRQSEQLVNELSLLAPFNGLVAKLNVTLGQEVRAGDVIAEIFDPNSLALYVRAPVRYRLDQRTLSELVAIDHQGVEWQAVAMRPVNESGAQRITLQPKNKQTTTSLPGSHLALTLTYPVTEAAIDVPITAVYDQQRVYVFERDSGAIKAVDIAIVGRSATGYLISAAPFTNAGPIVTTRLKNPVTGMKVSVTRGNRGERS